MDALWDPIRFLETEPTARTFLTKRYQASGIDYPERHAFGQSTRLVYTFKQARAMYHAASRSDLLVQPLLLFYGCTHLLKGYILCCDPDYPQNSRMLQHGVTTRKLKKNPYHLLQDEVRPQKEGLFAYLTKLLLLSPIQERYTAGELFCSIAELAEDCRAILGGSHWQPIHFAGENGVVVLPSICEGSLAFSDETLLHVLNRYSPDGVLFLGLNSAVFEDAKPVRRGEKCYRVSLLGKRTLLDHPLFAKTGADRYYFWNGSPDQLPLPEWASHFLLLYLLGMLCRYETEWWGELVYSHAFAESFLVERFLAYHQAVFPRVIVQLLEKSIRI